MRVLLKEILDCPPDAAWRALASPAVFREVSGPLMGVESLETTGFPTQWEPGEHPVAMSGLGVLPLGEQMIRLNMRTNKTGVRIVRDTGNGVSGLMAGITHWDHSMAISPDPAGTGKTLYRDQLIFSAGPATLAVWPGLWAFWQLRMRKLKALAPSWRYDLGADDPAFVAAGAAEPPTEGDGLA
ncbi:hypothetical protein [Cryobacterium sp.]|jgi:hypothetical protein|uniref:hypothetical protein n=1 Tax=Cryobacterium sp. TaxID=1926290 RepID=UPI0026222929|nr:hypothetical protein [Cryobacterium sp.]MCU1446186.1 hypothetical protein [Cryobacterium sp.]